MQSNFTTVKITRKPKQQEASEKALKQGYKGRDKVATWKRGTDKRDYFTTQDKFA